MMQLVLIQKYLSLFSLNLQCIIQLKLEHLLADTVGWLPLCKQIHHDKCPFLASVQERTHKACKINGTLFQFQNRPYNTLNDKLQLLLIYPNQINSKFITH